MIEWLKSAIDNNKVLSFCIVGIIGVIIALIAMNKETSSWWVTLLVGVGLSWMVSFLVGLKWHQRSIEELQNNYKNQ
jgi:uncharacterized protein (DUF983 family)